MPIDPRITVNPLCSASSTFADDLRLWSSLGVRSVGLSSRKLADHGWDAGVAAARDAGLDVRYLLHGIYTRAGDDAGWAIERDALLRCVATAAEIGAPCVTFCSGAPGPQRWEEAADHLCRHLEPVITEAQRAGVRLAIENSLSLRVEFSFLHTLADTCAVAERLDIGVNADLYCCWVERGLTDTLRRHASRLALVQVADYRVGTLVQPARWVPGDADLPLARLLDDVLDAGYDGPIDLEILGPAIEEEGYAGAIERGVAWLTATLDRRPDRRGDG
jgi:sugar phosphate isomerase/epimerase